MGKNPNNYYAKNAKGLGIGKHAVPSCVKRDPSRVENYIPNFRFNSHNKNYSTQIHGDGILILYSALFGGVTVIEDRGRRI